LVQRIFRAYPDISAPMSGYARIDAFDLARSSVTAPTQPARHARAGGAALVAALSAGTRPRDRPADFIHEIRIRSAKMRAGGSRLIVLDSLAPNSPAKTRRLIVNNNEFA
jgi:hypothetical protein